MGREDWESRGRGEGGSGWLRGEEERREELEWRGQRGDDYEERKSGDTKQRDRKLIF